ncbi:ADP-ribosylation factor-like protein 2 [Histomonas meleagridis]|uniref:ADP-ribosylation factor-like protein 2 n=1 Tax=Histomonas meleagridis TaxID=135588 RepID=UPI00355A7B53|nr:ADP-ribosylation factor-like protein 2 [Histomonas meleagridis]KAH0801419.1 ADP-ribosylation factor-like protein 2 [Histomonas meleagridis]
MTGGSPQTTSPTRGFNVKSMVFNGVDLNAFDIGGQQSLRIYWANYYPKTNGIVWVIDSTDRRRMFETGLELVALLKEPKLEGKPLLILANKQDLATAMIASEVYLCSNYRFQMNLSCIKSEIGIGISKIVQQ